MASSLFAFAVQKPRVLAPPPNVIDETMIFDSIELERKLDEQLASALSKETPDAEDDEIVLSKVTSLTLSFRSIERIQNLLTLDSLEVLKLDNNLIKEITGLDALPKLRWLDLSFNSITRISGLDKLPALTDLALTNNGIESLDGLGDLKTVEVLTLGSNRITSLSEVNKLRRMPALRVLTLAGNPLERRGAASVDYRGAILARLQSLQYLDFERVSDEERSAAVESHRQDLEKLRKADEEHAAATAAADAEATRETQLQAAGLQRVAGLWGALQRDTEEDSFIVARTQEQLLKVPDLEEWWAAHHTRVVEKVDAVVAEALKQQEAIDEEAAALDFALEQVRREGDEEGKAVVDAFQAARKRLERALEEEGGMTTDEAAARIRAVQEHNEGMRTALIEAELALHETCDGMVLTFDKAYDEIKAARTKLVTELFKSVLELEGTFRDECKQHLASLGEQLATEGAGGVLRLANGSIIRQGSLDPDTLGLIQDREQGVSLISRFRDSRITQVYAQEGEWKAEEQAREEQYVKARQAAELARHRQRCKEVEALCAANERELADFMAMGLEGDEE